MAYLNLTVDTTDGRAHKHTHTHIHIRRPPAQMLNKKNELNQRWTEEKRFLLICVLSTKRWIWAHEEGEKKTEIRYDCDRPLERRRRRKKRCLRSTLEYESVHFWLFTWQFIRLHSYKKGWPRSSLLLFFYLRIFARLRIFWPLDAQDRRHLSIKLSLRFSLCAFDGGDEFLQMCSIFALWMVQNWPRKKVNYALFCACTCTQSEEHFFLLP